MAVIHLVEGPVGAGKSTIASRLSREFLARRFILDDWTATLFRPDRPSTDVIGWYSERKNRCIDHIFELASDMWEPINESECSGLLQQCLQPDCAV